MKRVFNFSSGPAILPVPVLEEASRGVLELGGSGMSVLEVSHRSKPYERIHFEARDRALRLLGLSPDEYVALFLGGGASLQFAMLPMNFLKPQQVADYANTGEWAVKAMKEARRYGQVHEASTSAPQKFSRIEKRQALTPGAAYLHLTTNNTIEGTQWGALPDPQGAPLVADASSDILGVARDHARFAAIYAGAQKNLGPAGVTLVVLRKSLLQTANADVPTMLAYKTHAETDSLYNTPPAFAIYVVGLVLRWIEEQGGVPAMDRQNREKASWVYQALDEFPGTYEPAVTDPADRSVMNLTFRLRGATPEREARFLEGALARQLDGLKGHRSVGGFRASIYNAFPREGCAALAEYLRHFARSGS